MHILVVDDVPVVRMVIAKALTRAGHCVSEAGDGAEALRALQRAGADVLVTDVWMPGQNGIDLIGAARAHFPGLAVVAMSGGNPQSGITDSLLEAEQAGATVSVMKPIDKNELLAAVDEAVRRSGKGV